MPISIIDTIKPKNNGNFPVVESPDVDVGAGKRLDAVLPAVYGDQTGVVVPTTLITQAEYDALLDDNAVEEGRLYLIYEDE